jgi:uncharacterized protein YegP (UPF0339 family)
MAKFEMFQDKAGEWRWRLKATNGQQIASSGEGYSSKSACENGINAVKRDAPDAEVTAG